MLGFLKRTVEKKVANHKRLWRPARAGALDVEETLAASTESDPEGTAELYEQLPEGKALEPRATHRSDRGAALHPRRDEPRRDRGGARPAAQHRA